VRLNVEINNKLFISTEGSNVQVSESYLRLFINANCRADDGMLLPLHLSYFAFDFSEFPNEDSIKKDINKLINTLDGLRKSESAETFSGPALLSGEASGVFLHEIFGHRVEGFREKDPDYANTFKSLIGQKVLPDFIDVVFDPTLKYYKNVPISGFYQYDDEGIKAEKVETIKKGVFHNYLMSRSPIDGFDHSNGHGRKVVGRSAVTRQSNLIVNTSKPLTNSQLRQMLKEEARKQDKEYGLFFDKVAGGFTQISRFNPNAFNVTPLVVYKIYVDGRPDEIVRGIDLIGTPLTTFSNIIATGDDFGIFNGICGAESGGIPVSSVSPTVLVSKIEVQKKLKSQAKPPILESPLNTNKTP
jgi:predicted Zn-dependent protease